MMKMIHAATLGAALLLAAPLAAQHQHGAGHGGQHAQHGAVAHGAHMSAESAHMHPPAVRELNHRTALGLSAEQVSRLEAIQGRMKAMCQEHGPHMKQGMAEMRTLVQGADSVAFRTVAQRQSAMMLEMQMDMHRAYRDARAVLTPAQVQKLDAMHAAHHGPAAAAGGAHANHGAQAAAGAHGAGHGGMDCNGMPCCAMGGSPRRPLSNRQRTESG